MPEPEAPPLKRARVIQLIHVAENTVQTLSLTSSDTLSTVADAERSFRGLAVPPRLFTAIGTPIDTTAVADAFQQIYVYDGLASDQTVPDVRRIPPQLSSRDVSARIQFLRKQGPWVALDEMTYYLQMLQATGHTGMIAPCFVPPGSCDDPLADNLAGWFDKCAALCSTEMQVATALLIESHWLPVVFRMGVGAPHVLTTCDCLEWIDAATQHLSKPPEATVIPMGRKFAFDCGFQCISWLISAVMYTEYEECAPLFDPGTATTWRGRFEQHLFAEGSALTEIRPSDIPCGGVAKQDLLTQVQQLLENHGVPASQSGSRAEAVMDKIGRGQVANVMRAANPWRDLKSLANQCSPKMQLVLASEMQLAIERRLQDPKPFGAKKKRSDKQERKTVALEPDDVSIPDGIFKEGDSQPVNQLTLSQIGPQARGVVVVSSIQASPYLKVTSPVSAAGLALLVLDFDATVVHGLGELVRLPAHCNRSGEPILLTAKLIQLGSSVVTRLIAPQIPRVEEVPNAVIKSLVYRDEMSPQGWDDFMKRPVKWLITHVPELSPEAADHAKVLDCWDRQTLSAKLERTPTNKAAVFVVTLRVMNTDVNALLKKSGHDSIYFEPRTEDGRQHDDKFRVIWLNRVDKASAVLAVQSTTVWASLVRSGDRFGIRVLAQEAAVAHKQHKPSLPYLDAQTLLSYIAGPFPYGATRQSLAKLFAVWNWAARPIQPRGRSGDNTGIMWEVQAAAAPQYGVYQLEHADVLITEQPKKTRQQAEPRQHIQGSARTMAALTKTQAPPADLGTTDPWLRESCDPWSGWTPPSKMARRDLTTSGASTDSIADKVERKVLRAIENKIPKLGENDAVMSSSEDTRIADLEAKLLHLENIVQMNQITQEKNHLEVTTHVATLQSQVETQAGQLQQHFDQRMSEQLMHIERLLKKRSGE